MGKIDKIIVDKIIIKCNHSTFCGFRPCLHSKHHSPKHNCDTAEGRCLSAGEFCVCKPVKKQTDTG